MAESQRVRIVANKGRRARRNMTAKQIRFFGTKAQRAALKANRSKRSPHRKRTAAAKKTHRRARRLAVKQNAGEIVGYTLLANKGTKRSSRKTAKKGTQMASTKKARRRSAASGHHKTKHHRRTRQNTGKKMHHRRRHNPGLGAIGPLITTSAFALAGAAASKIIPQMLLGANNTSWVGYGANALTGFLLWLAADRILKNRTAATGVAIGTAVMIMDRMINDMTPFGSYLSGAGFGDYQAQAFVTPQVLQDPYNSAAIRIPGPWLPPLPMPASTPSKAAAAVGVGAYGGGNLYGGHSSLY